MNDPRDICRLIFERLMVAVTALAAVAAVLYALLSNEFFILHCVLPCVSELRPDVRITADSLELEPLSGYLNAAEVKVRYQGREVFSADSVQGCISLLPLMKRIIRFNDVEVNGGTVNLLPEDFMTENTEECALFDFTDIDFRNSALSMGLGNSAGADAAVINFEYLNMEKFGDGLPCKMHGGGKLSLRSGAETPLDGKNIKVTVEGFLETGLLPRRVSLGAELIAASDDSDITDVGMEIHRGPGITIIDRLYAAGGAHNGNLSCSGTITDAGAYAFSVTADRAAGDTTACITGLIPGFAPAAVEITGGGFISGYAGKISGSGKWHISGGGESHAGEHGFKLPAFTADLKYAVNWIPELNRGELAELELRLSQPDTGGYAKITAADPGYYGTVGKEDLPPVRFAVTARDTDLTLLNLLIRDWFIFPTVGTIDADGMIACGKDFPQMNISGCAEISESAWKFNHTDREFPAMTMGFNAEIEDENRIIIHGIEAHPENGKMNFSGSFRLPKRNIRKLRADFHCAADSGFVNLFTGEQLGLSKGGIRADGKYVWSGARRQLDLSGQIKLEDGAAVTAGENEFAGAGADIRTEITYSQRKNKLDIHTLDAELRCGGKTAARIRCPGELRLDRGEYSGKWHLTYIDGGELRRWVQPDFSTVFTGSAELELELRNRFENGKAKGRAEMNGINSGGKAEANGISHWELNWDNRDINIPAADIILTCGGREILHCDGQLFPAAEDAPRTADIRLSALELPELLELMPDLKNENDADKMRRREENFERLRPELYGTDDQIWKIRIDNAHLTGRLTLDSDIELERRNNFLRSRRFRTALNGSGFNGTFSAVDEQGRGIHYELRLDGEDELELAPLIEASANAEYPDLQCRQKQINLQMRWLDDGTGNCFSDNGSGHLHIRFGKMSIPSSLGEKPVWRIILFPADVLFGLWDAVPDMLSVTKIDRAALRRKLFTVKFNSGEAALKLKNGRCELDKCVFFGDILTRVYFEGNIAMNKRRDLNLTGYVTAGGIQTAMPIEGCAADPVMRLDKMPYQSFLALLQKIGTLNLVGLSGSAPDAGRDDPVIMLDQLAAPLQLIPVKIWEMWK